MKRTHIMNIINVHCSVKGDPISLTYTPDSTLTVLQHNVEDLSNDKCDYLAHSSKDEAVDVLSLQETHVSLDRVQTYLITGFVLICQHVHPKFQLAIYLTSSSPPLHIVTYVATIGVSINGLSVYNKYKTPTSNSASGSLLIIDQPTLVTSEFSIQSTTWLYNNMDDSGEVLQNWISAMKLWKLCTKSGQPGGSLSIIYT